MRHPFPTLSACLVILSTLPTIAQATRTDDPAAALKVLDAKQKEMVARADVAGLAALSGPELTINAPTNRILSRDQFLAMMKNGQIGAEAFDRSVESAIVSGPIGIVMGSEIFTPTAASELGKTYGVVPLRRRYTNIYRREGETWKWVARHANVVPGATLKAK